MIDYIPGGLTDVRGDIPAFKIKQYDNNSHQLHLIIIDKDNPFGSAVDLTGHTLTAYYRLPDGSDEFVPCEIENAKVGKIAVDFPGSVTQQVGTVQVEIVINGASNSVLTLKTFRFEVIETIRDSAAMEATEKYSVLDALISRQTELMETVEAVQEGYQEILDDIRRINERISEIEEGA